jgi:hypothetical protein
MGRNVRLPGASFRRVFSKDRRFARRRSFRHDHGYRSLVRQEHSQVNLNHIPLLKQLEPARRILLSGAGGGFDVFCGLPIYFHLRDMGKDVFLGNLSFSDLGQVSGRSLAPAVREVRADSVGTTSVRAAGESCR